MAVSTAAAAASRTAITAAHTAATRPAGREPREPNTGRSNHRELIVSACSADFPPGGGSVAVVAHDLDDELNGYFTRLVERAVRHPSDDLLGRVVVPGHRAGELTLEEAAVLAQTLFHAGHGQTAFMITLGAAVLLREPRQYQALGDEGAERRVRSAVEELLRYITTAHTARQRVATRDLTIGSTVIRAGDGVLVQLDAANRDPEAFPDPDRFDIGRPLKPNLAFGRGPHQCLGAALARLEFEVAFTTLARRLPLLRLARPADRPGPRDDENSLRLDSLLVTWPDTGLPGPAPL
jgi:cytochrome P450